MNLHLRPETEHPDGEATEDAPAPAGAGPTGPEGEVRRALSELVTRGVLDLPAPGHGETARRHLALLDVARDCPVSVARLAEAHVDAVAIIAEAGGVPHPAALYGVWASAGREELAWDGEVLSGTKPFCSGLGIVDRALVTVRSGRDHLLLDVDVRAGPSVEAETASWSTPALRSSATGAVTFDRLPVGPEARVGGPGWYLRRPGFWHGACGPAACWAGAAIGLADHVEAQVGSADEDPHRMAHLGAMRALTWSMRALLAQAGDEIDADPTNGVAARARALSVRHVVERQCTELLDRFGQAFGPRPFVADRRVSQRFSDVHLYLRQNHAERDLHTLAMLRPDGAVR